jgi:hypothetical protein
MSQNYDVEDQEMYSLGAAYDVEPIETKYRTFVVADFLAFLEDEDLFGLIARRRPFKLFNLVYDGVSELESKRKEKLALARCLKEEIAENNRNVTELIGVCRRVRV